MGNYDDNLIKIKEKKRVLGYRFTLVIISRVGTSILSWLGWLGHQKFRVTNIILQWLIIINISYSSSHIMKYYLL